LSDNIIINTNTPNQATMRATNTAGVFWPHSYAELWVANNNVTNTNPVPEMMVLANGTPVVAGSNAFPVVENNSANIALNTVNNSVQISNVATQVALGLQTSNGSVITGVNAANNRLPAQAPDAGNISAGVGSGKANTGATGSLFGVIDTTGYTSIAVQVMNSGNGSVISYLGSTDNATWIAMSGSVSGQGGSGNPPTNTTSNSTGNMVFGCKMRYFQANVSTYSGSVNVNATYVMRQAPHVTDSVFINNNTTNKIPVTVQNTATIAVATDVSTLFATANVPLTPQYTLINNITAANDVIAPVSGKKITVHAMTLSVTGGLMTVTVQSNTTPSGNLSVYYLANTGNPLVLPFNPVGWFKNLNSNESIRIVPSNANTVGGCIVWTSS
jgi:hypothetical protein